MRTLWSGTRRSAFRLALVWLFDGAAPKCIRYRVNATVMIACVPVFSKQNVGGAYLGVEQTLIGGAAVTRLEFAAGSWPERLKGFNRFGATRETVREENGGVVESAYVSFMASSREQNFTEAREAFRRAPESLPLAVARGRSTSAGCAFAIEHRAAPGNYSWRNCLDLAGGFDDLPLPAAAPLEEYPGGALPTFLFALRRAILTNSPAATTLYTHNGKVYRLRTRSQIDPRSNELAFTCRISSRAEPGQTEFKLWLASRDRTALPTRIEFHPKSFLKLTLEQEKE
jgi:hypothetical protein